MTFQPVLPPLLLAAVAAAIVVVRVVALNRLTAVGRTRPAPAGRSEATRGSAQWRWCGLTLAALLLLAAATRPVIGSDEQGTVRVAGDGDPNVFLVVDRSADMRVDDLAGGRERMAGARDDIAALIDRYPHARFAVIAFASRPSLDWPLSQDTWSLRPVMSALTPYASAPDAVYQTNVGAAGNVLRYQLIGARQQYPRAQNLVFYLGAGAGETQAPQRQFELPDGAVDGGAVLGYGSAHGGAIPGTDVARSVIGERALRGVADQIGVPYVPRDGATPLTGVLADEGTDVAPPPPVAAPPGRAELYWAPAVGAAILILIELYLVLREFRRTRLANADVVV
ncbi:MAG: Ca-activated chloride channel [Mycobacterium sp.]|nr:Ca-activated chloride channel [Mycobacterium sp.]